MKKNWLEMISGQNQIQTIMKSNEYTKQFGLILTEKDAEVLALGRQNALKEQQRVEFGQGIMPKLIFEFCDSAFIDQSHYVDILLQLQDIFYLYKNEVMDEITDDELMHFMKEQFETTCYGDLDYLSGTCLEIFAQAIRAGYQGEQDFDLIPKWDRELYMEALKNLFGE
ncbi:MAG: hypothetical protein EOM34_07555 [Clostridia bacterium]|jgi:hypothetical protein|nr:DUF6323 family protein [Lachnospiraceae bacterium]NCC00525.1 hypothetical protein [Clostridia bacterium]NCD02534.1 hypothetical protein [Clostridia bacterium]